MMSSLGLWLFALALLLSWTNSALHVALPDRPLYAMSPNMFREKASSTRLVWIGFASLGFLALLYAFLQRIRPEWVAGAILLVLFGIRRLEIVQWHDDIVVRLGKYVPSAACLLGWLVTSVLLQSTGKPREVAHALGWQAACGVYAGAHVLAAIAKVRQSGLVWVHPRYQALLVAERAFAGPKLIRSIRLGVARSKRASAVVGTMGFASECLAGLFVIPDARLVVIALVLLLHLGFMVLLGYFELEWIVVMLAVAALAS
jgi:hypothetical protein